MKSKILTMHLSVVMLLCSQSAFSMNNVTTLINTNNQRSFEVLRNSSIDDNVLNTSKRKNVEKNGISESSNLDNNECNDPLVDSCDLGDDYILNDDSICFVLSDPNRSNQKLYQFKDIEIFGNIDVLQSKTLKIYTCGTVDDYWNANIIGEDNRGVFLRGKPEHATFGALSLLGPINALRLIPEMGQEISIFTNQKYVFDGITDWINKWKTKNWMKSDKQPVKHQKLWRELDKQTARHLVKWHKFRTPNRNLLSFPTGEILNIEEKISTYAGRVIDWLNTQQATFSQGDIENVVRPRVNDQTVAAKIIKEIKEQALPVGTDCYGNLLYTGEKYKKSEEYVMGKFRDLSNTLSQIQCSESFLNEVLSKEEYSFLSDEQTSAIKDLTQGSNFGVLVGKAGTGKTTAMKAVSEIFKAHNRRTIGMCLSAVASENLGREANIESRSIAGWCYRWESYDEAVSVYDALTSDEERIAFTHTLLGRHMKEYRKFQLKKGDIIVVDEASMVSTDDWGAILKFATRFGAKVIAVGDNHQFSPISAGNMFEQFVQKSDSVNELKEIRRQTQAWQREASIEFSKLNTKAALEMYKDHGKIHEVDDNLEKMVVDKFWEHFEKGKNVVVLCSTKAECSKINNQIRELLIKNDKLGKSVAKVNGRTFAENEKVMFLENDSWLDVKNGQQGTVKSFENGILKIETEDGAIKFINLKDYDDINYAYAITLHKSQGKTYDNTIVIAHKNMINSTSAYVGMTRHRDDVDFYYKRSIFGSFENLVKCASRREYKDSLVDYQDIDHSNRDKVAEFIKLYEQIDNETNNTQVNQDEYQSKKNRAAGLGEEILGDYDVYKLYLKQMGLTRETVEEIHAELKKELQTSSPLESEVSRKIREETSGKIKEMQEWNERITEELLSLKNENLKGTHKVISNPIKGKRERNINLFQTLGKKRLRKGNIGILDPIKRKQRRAMVSDLFLSSYLENKNLERTHKVISNPIKGKLERKIGLSQFLEKEESKKTIKEISDQIRRIQDWRNIYITEMNTFPQNEPPKETNKSSSDRIKGIQEWNERAMEVLRSLKDENLNKGIQELENDCIKETKPYREISSELSSSQQDTDINTTKEIIFQNCNNYLRTGNGYKRLRLRRYW